MTKDHVMDALGAFPMKDVFEPSESTRHLWVIRFYTAKGWQYLRMKKDEAAIETVVQFASRFESAAK